MLDSGIPLSSQGHIEPVLPISLEVGEGMKGQGQVQTGHFLDSWVMDARHQDSETLGRVLKFIFNNEYFVVVVILGNARLSLSNEIALK